jgi:2-C-methyl-D-erythritol 4-phosphate cytidylyltransferase
VSHSVTAIIAAAGSGERLAAGTPKALIDLAGRNLVDRAVSLFADVSDQIIICAPSSHLTSLSESYAANEKVVVVAGGSTRSLSIRNAISALAKDTKFVLVHDAARALTPISVVQRVLAELKRGAEGVVPVLPLADTVKEVMGDKVVRTVDRTSLQRVQTPQGFKAQIIIDAHAAAKRDGVDGTDDASLVERMGIKVNTVPGDEIAFKITTAHDLDVANALASDS